jgi:hypothetical protein
VEGRLTDSSGSTSRERICSSAVITVSFISAPPVGIEVLRRGCGKRGPFLLAAACGGDEAKASLRVSNRAFGLRSYLQKW